MQSSTLSSVLLCAILILTGCGGDGPTRFDHLVSVDPSSDGLEVKAEEAIGLIEALGYQSIRDSLIQNLDRSMRLNVAVYQVQEDGSTVLQDSSVLGVENEDSFTWLRQLLPEQQTFATLRNQEMFRYLRSESGTGRGTVQTEVISGSDVPGGLVSITLSYELNPQTLTDIRVIRDGGGLFFTERSSMEMTLHSGAFRSLDNTVILTLPFRDAVAYRTVALPVGESLENRSE